MTLRGVITSSCKRPDIAIRWLDYWYSDEGRKWILHGGQEGEQWWWEKGESINGTGEIVKQSDDYNTLRNAAWTTSVVPSIITEDDFDVMDASQLDTNAYLRNELDRRIYKEFAVYHNWPSHWTTDGDLGREFGELTGTLRSYVAQAYTSFIMGMTDMNDDAAWQAYLDGLLAAGLERYLEIATDVAKGAE